MSERRHAPRGRRGSSDDRDALQEALAAPEGARAVPPALLDRLPGAQLESSVPALQRAAGNAAVRRVLGGRTVGVQRHGEGELTIDPADADNPDAEGAAEAPVAEGPATEGAAPQETAAPEAPAAEGEKKEEAAGADKKPAPAKPAYLDLATAQDVLTKAYGDVHKIVPGKIEFLEDDAKTWDKYDELCIAGNVQFVSGTTKRKWQKGDAKTKNPLGLRGFAWRASPTSTRPPRPRPRRRTRCST